jgi:hypothetical protein
MCTQDLTRDCRSGFRGHIVLIEPTITNDLINELRLREVISFIAYTLLKYVEPG